MRCLAAPPVGERTWDDIGAVLGESGITRLMRMALDRPDAARIIIRLPHSADSTSGESRASDELLSQLREWCECKLAVNAAEIRRSRRVGGLAVLFATAALAVALGTSLALQSDVIFGPPGAIRGLISEAIIIAGWVVMWRPCEILLFDAVRPAGENRLLRKILAMTWSIETVGTTAREPS